ncbi:PREDICTED: ATP-binding cassette sub-family G member 1 [Nicrophorus vespilloides]|uniref:ATP-binding cassette sub-family G member 1 n=1 Tax=Nicrophorus vespilloides TaxID=110193 RepID=A0ABM1MT68_NICVS|nr:PREDICTED: ATP-binding cassette sub-family G member 1 [Nicrophorus vespilloides]
MEAVLQEAASVTLDTNGASAYANLNPTEEDTVVPLVNQTEDAGFSMLPSTEPVDMQFENIVFTATTGLFKKEKKEILHKINGRFPQGQLIAIMGPSGAGKSTLLDVLSGYRITGIEGTVYTNGTPRDLNAFRKLSCYITQDDRLQPLLTVKENMKVAADLKLGTDVTQKEKDAIIGEILKTLGLDKAVNTRAARLSGGQKKRLSIALELVNNPQVMFLDEPTTGLDSSSCSQCVKLLQFLAHQGRTIVCTIHQPSASLFQLFDQVYVLAAGKCLYQGSTDNLVPFLEDVDCPCPMYHNPADYAIELACGEYGEDKIDRMVKATDNGKTISWLKNFDVLPTQKALKDKYRKAARKTDQSESLHATSASHQLKILLKRDFLKSRRDSTLTYMRIGVNAITGLMLGTLYWQAGVDGSKVIDNYNLLFSILMHHMMSTMMLTILTFPNEMSILTKEHFNRWYSLKMYYTSVTLVDIPISIFCCIVFTVIIYTMTAQPPDMERFGMFSAISILVVFVAQSFGLMIGAVFNVVNGTFLGPTLSVPMMMFAGFGVSLKDLPPYLYWGSYISYLRYGLEGIVGAIYGMERPTLDCPGEKYCHYKYPTKFLKDIDIKGDQFTNDIISLLIILFFLRIVAYVLLRWKLVAVR